MDDLHGHHGIEARSRIGQQLVDVAAAQFGNESSRTELLLRQRHAGRSTIQSSHGKAAACKIGEVTTGATAEVEQVMSSALLQRPGELRHIR